MLVSEIVNQPTRLPDEGEPVDTTAFSLLAESVKLELPAGQGLVKHETRTGQFVQFDE